MLPNLVQNRPNRHQIELLSDKFRDKVYEMATICFPDKIYRSMIDKKASAMCTSFYRQIESLSVQFKVSEFELSEQEIWIGIIRGTVGLLQCPVWL